VWIAIGFVLPVLAYLLGRALVRGRPAPSSRLAPDGPRVLLLAIALAAIPAAAVVALVLLNPDVRWPGATQVAWTGVEATAADVPLAIGGRGDQAVTAWPNGSFFPRLEARQEGGTVQLRASGGTAFVKIDNGVFVNGTVVPQGGTGALGAFSVRVGKRFPIIGRHPVTVLDPQGRVLASLRLPQEGADRVYRMSVRLAPDIRRLRANGEAANGALALDLEDWGEDTLLMVSAAGEIRILGRDETQGATISPPCNIIVHWPPAIRQRLQIVRTASGSLAVCFPPPWRRASPAPPADKLLGTSATFTVTSHPAPGDKAFVLPFGGGVPDPRSELAMTVGIGRIPVFAASQGGTGAEPAGDDVSPYKRVTSRVRVPTGKASFELVTVRDLPSAPGLIALMCAAWIVLAWGLLVLNPRVESRDYWSLTGLVLFAWTLLCLRLLLALRYALAPDHVDQLALKGMAVAFAALVAVPAVIVLAARFHRDGQLEMEERSRGGGGVLAFIAVALGLSIVEFALAPRLWADLPRMLHPSLLDRSGGILLLWAVIYYLLSWYTQYRVEVRRGGVSKPVRISCGVLMFPLRALDWARYGHAAQAWNSITRQIRGWPRVLIASFFIGGLIGLAALYFAVSADRIFQELAVPALLFFLPGLICLSCIHPRSEESVRPAPIPGYLLALVLLVLLPILLVPSAIQDVGGILSALAVYIPIGLVLMFSRSRRAALAVALGVLLPIGLAVVLQRSAQNLPSWTPRIAVVRLLSHREGDALQRYLPRATLEGKEASGGLPLHSLREAIEHSWENQAMAHEGGIFGLGFNNAPVRRSAVPQDTLQFDSVYSFFILSEHGLIGGAALILLYATPLFFVLVSARRRFDFGHAVAIVAVSALLLEALFHMMMNLGVMPFTGRNLPLLAANSITDPVRWAVFLAIAAQAVLWRTDGVREGFRADMPSIHQARGGGTAQQSPVWFVLTLLVLLVVPGWMALKVVSMDRRLIAPDRFKNPFSWQIMLKRVQEMADQGLITVDQGTRTLALDSSRATMEGWPLTGWSLVEQEIARFNALPEDERFEGRYARRERDSDLRTRLRAVDRLADYDRLLADLRDADLAELTRRPSLFLLGAETRDHDVGSADDGGIAQGDSTFVLVNPAYDSRISFQRNRDRDQMPTCSLVDRKGRQLVGPAWARGEWTPAYVLDADYPWSGSLAGALTEEWKALGPDAARDRNGVLSLDPELHSSAQAFARTLGRAAYDSALIRGSPNHAPTRAAVTVLALPRGEVLAMGGWPRMWPGQGWQMVESEPVPPVGWVERRAPGTLRWRYDTDRNLDRLVVGSASKPLWASAVLAVHPRLRQQLLTRGEDDREAEVFGMSIPTRKAWAVHPGPWTSWDAYMAMSDNRYHVRVGFLGLADQLAGDVLPGGDSSSPRESLTGAPRPWGHYPAFPARLVVTRAEPGGGPPRLTALQHLDESFLAGRLRAMYGIGVQRDARVRRLSFWTSDEADDLPDTLRDKPRLAGLSPVAPDFAFDHVASGREYVNLLLGGQTNTWANVDFAAAFGSCVTGHGVIAHVNLPGDPPRLGAGRQDFPVIARELRPGLAQVITRGTATARLGPEAQAFLASLHGAKCYAKTGTLNAAPGEPPLSRIVMALVRWDNERAGTVKRGLVVSIVAERAGWGTATGAMGRFLLENTEHIRRALGVTDRR
jgi:cell division protein FtsW (lipid II flippase)